MTLDIIPPNGIGIGCVFDMPLSSTVEHVKRVVFALTVVVVHFSYVLSLIPSISRGLQMVVVDHRRWSLFAVEYV